MDLRFGAPPLIAVTLRLQPSRAGDSSQRCERFLRDHHDLLEFDTHWSAVVNAHKLQGVRTSREHDAN